MTSRKQTGCESRAENKNTLLARFKIQGNPRFLSHRQTMRLFERALIRAGIEVCYSEGFNPHPKLSLPFPRSVGIESDDELLCVPLPAGGAAADAEAYKKSLTEQLPCGCELFSVELIKQAARFYPASATYVFDLAAEPCTKAVRKAAERLIKANKILVERRIYKNSRMHTVDVRPFIHSIDFNSHKVNVTCTVTSAGTVRLPEIMKLLAIDESMLAGPVRRTCIQWKSKY